MTVVQLTRCALCETQIVGVRTWPVRVWVADTLYTDEGACHTCWCKVSLAGEVEMELKGARVVVRALPQNGARV
jgi:hypothetical protein